MRRYRLAAAVTVAAAMLAGVAPAGDAAAGAAAPGMRAAPGARLWVARYDDRSGGYDAAHAMAVSPDGSRVFVTGDSWGGATGRDYATVGYSAATGRQLWVSRYSGPGYGIDIAWSVAVSPDGSKVFVTGSSRGRTSNDDFATIAYNAATGRQLWVRRYNGPANKLDDAAAVAVSPAGTTVFVTGHSSGSGAFSNFATVAYGAATGRQLWVRRYGPANGYDVATAVAASPAGGRVFVTGQNDGDYGTVAYSAATGRQLWARRYNGPANGDDGATAVAVSPAGTTVFVTGSSAGRRAAVQDYATVAYSAATGRQLWVSRHKNGFAHAVAVSPDGKTVYVTGQRGYNGYLTVAYSAVTGRQLWASGSAGGDGSSVTVSPDGATVYVTGSSGAGSDHGYTTVAYSAATGGQLWASRYNGPANVGSACCVAVSPDGTAVFVTGDSYGGRTNYDYATIAYRG